MFAPYARTEVATIGLPGLLASFALAHFAGWWALLPAAMTAALLSFYRDPPRRVPTGDKLLVAPADGTVTLVEQAAGMPVRIVIFLSVLNVHVNRSPCAGRVTEVQYKPGLFLNALRPESTERNESNTITLEPRPPLPGPIVVRQIAGVLARRIVCAVAPGDNLTLGQRVGMIKLGSRTELILPPGERWSVRVRVGDRVKGGLTVLAEMHAEVRVASSE
ncbi:MAG: phosphatidylserine decarboxylase [Phycisphaerae bacterium]